jgi:uncharacterized protein
MMNVGGYALLFAGGFVSGLAGFGTALMALGICLYLMPPSLAVPLVLVCSVVGQSATLPSMWRSFDLSLIWPFLIGGLAGVPLGTILIAHADPQNFKLTVGVFLLVFPVALYFQRTPKALRFGGRLADGAIAFAGGILGGLAGLSGPLPILWASVTGWGKDERRGVFQTFNWTVLAAALCLQMASGLIGREVIWLALLALPARRLARRAGLSCLERQEFSRRGAGPVVSVGYRPGLEQPRPAVSDCMATPRLHVTRRGEPAGSENARRYRCRHRAQHFRARRPHA